MFAPKAFRYLQPKDTSFNGAIVTASSECELQVSDNAFGIGLNRTNETPLAVFRFRESSYSGETLPPQSRSGTVSRQLTTVPFSRDCLPRQLPQYKANHSPSLP